MITPAHNLKDYQLTDPFGNKYWYRDGELHRLDGPAIEYANGDQAYYLAGKLHRYNGPAFIAKDYVEWYHRGHKHRIDGPAVECKNGSQEWWIDGKRHRALLPAVIRVGGYKEWWLDGLRHRTDGPAVEGLKVEEWWIKGVKVAVQERKPAYNINSPAYVAARATHKADATPWSAGVEKRYTNYMVAVKSNQDAANDAAERGLIQLQTIYEEKVAVYNKALDLLKRDFPRFFKEQEEKQNTPQEKPQPMNRMKFAEDLALSALQGYFGYNSVYDMKNGMAKSAAQSVYKKLDELFATIQEEVATNPDIKELEQKTQSSVPENTTSTTKETKTPCSVCNDLGLETGCPKCEKTKIIALGTTSSTADLPDKQPLTDSEKRGFWHL